LKLSEVIGPIFKPPRTRFAGPESEGESLDDVLNSILYKCSWPFFLAASFFEEISYRVNEVGEGVARFRAETNRQATPTFLLFPRLAEEQKRKFPHSGI
jgi:hypothetical protein